MAAGKSTVAQRLAELRVRSVHVRGDVFRRFMVGGRVEPEPEMSEEAWAQLRLRYRLAVTTADLYAEAGFAVVLQDVILGPVLAEVVAMIKTRPRYVVVLDPDPAVIAARAAHRSKGGYSASSWDARQLVTGLRETTPAIGLWLNTAGQTPLDTAHEILGRLDEALVDAH